MKIGIIDMFKDKNGLKILTSALFFMGVTPVVYRMESIISKKTNLVLLIVQTDIRHWIFTDSSCLLDEKMPPIPLGVFDILNKKLLFISYSMLSALKSLGCLLIKRKERLRERFKLQLQQTKIFLFDKVGLFYGFNVPLELWRNRRYLVTANKSYCFLKEIASFRDETNIAIYKNATFVQFIPERTVDGRKFLYNWLYEEFM